MKFNKTRTKDEIKFTPIKNESSSVFVSPIGKAELDDYVEKIIDGKLSFRRMKDVGILIGDYIQLGELDRIVDSVLRIVQTRREKNEASYSRAVAQDIARMRGQVEQLKAIIKKHCPQDALVEEIFRCS